jgi:hypothetical protein
MIGFTVRRTVSTGMAKPMPTEAPPGLTRGGGA